MVWNWGSGVGIDKFYEWGPSSKWERRIPGERAGLPESPASLRGAIGEPRMSRPAEMNKGAAGSFCWVYGALAGLPQKSCRSLSQALPGSAIVFRSEVGPRPVCLSQPSSDQSPCPALWSASLLSPLFSPLPTHWGLPDRGLTSVMLREHTGS